MRQRLLILVVAYHASSTLVRVIERIPEEVFEQFDCEILVVDDASTDDTYALGRRLRDERPDLPLRVLRNRQNQGYGGNQKIGYAYAAKHGFDFVAMLHGDGQYAPECLPDLLEPFRHGADMVFGSRMSQHGEARKGGMPTYKYVGNRVLTRIQNLVLRTSFSEFHSGYRIYRVATLERTHYRLNTNDFHFDTEVILQLLAINASIVERPIPTYYGDEISRVNGLLYAWHVIRVTLQFAIHRLGLREQRRFDPADLEVDYRLKLGYPSSHQWAIDAVSPGARVLDLGGGSGDVARELSRRGCDVTVVDKYIAAGSEPSPFHAVRHDLNEPLTLDVRAFDYILLLDVIEHLASPEQFLEDLRARLDDRPITVILTTPNVAFFVQRLTLLAGQFNYGKSGILDRTHTRLFTFRTLRHLLTDAGFRIVSLRGIPAPFPLAIGDGNIARMLLTLNIALIRFGRRLFSFQILAEATSTPSIDYLVGDAETGSAL